MISSSGFSKSNKLQANERKKRTSDVYMPCKTNKNELVNCEYSTDILDNLVLVRKCTNLDRYTSRHHHKNEQHYTLHHTSSLPSVQNYLVSEELAEVIEHNGKNWRGIGISFLVITLISCVIFSTVLFFSPELKDLVDEQQRKELISLDEIMNMNYYPKAFNGSFLSDDILIYKDEYNNLIRAAITNQTLDGSIWVKNISFNEWGASSGSKYYVSADSKYVLFPYDSRSIYRHSSQSKYRIISIEEETSTSVHPKDENNTSPSHQAELNFVSWSPRGSAMIIAYKNNLYFRPSVDGETQQVTHSTANDQKFGIPDWLYEEEIFSKEQAVWWSPNGQAFAYAKFDDSQVVNISFSWYGGFDDEKIPQYPPLISIPYPKAGRPNPTISLYVNKIKEDGTVDSQVEVKAPVEVPVDNYLLTFTWIDDTSAIIQFANRVQNESFFAQCTNLGTDQSDCSLNLNFRPSISGYGWVDILNEPFIDRERSVYYIKMSSVQSNQFGAFKHLAQVKLNELNDQKKVKIFTSGLFEVVDILALDTKRNEIYYTATEQFKPASRRIMKSNIATGRSDCLTCKLNPNCLDYSAVISTDKNYWVLTCTGPIIPYVELRSLADNEHILTLEKNSEISETLSKKYLPKIKRFMLPIAGGKYNASVKMLLPPNLKDHELHKYPMLINTYAGPGSQVVKNNFIINWGYYLVTNKNIVVTFIDGRGSGFQGDSMLFEIYRKLGTVEIEDQLAVASRLIKIFEFIDPKKVGFFGWSYGYTTSMALAIDDQNLIKCGISVAPTTDWLFYDSAYTERYMGLPTLDDNLEGYINASLLNKVHKIKSNKLLLVHGSSDDNVHLQHSMLYIKQLNMNNILFQLQIYPDQAHGLVNVGRHVYMTFEKFLTECFELNHYSDQVGLQRKRMSKNMNR